MKVRRIVVSMLIMAFVSMMISGCSEGDMQKVSVAVVMGVHSNANTIGFDSDALHSALYEASYSHGEVSFVTCEGSPKVIYSASIPEPSTKGLSENKQRLIAEKYTKELKQILLGATPDSEEVDTLKSIRYSVDILKQADGKKLLCIMDTGIQTTGYLDLSTGLLEAEPEDIVKALKNEDALPDLSGIDVMWYFLGQSAKPQKPLSEYQKGRLQAMWEAVLKAGGAKLVEFSSIPATNKPYSGLPSVKVIDADKEKIKVKAGKKKKEVIVKKMVLDSNELRFEGDKAEFIDIKEAKQVLSGLAEALSINQKTEIIIIGSTAGGKNKKFSKRLSADRANAVKNVLVSMGVEEGRIKTLGLADEDPWHIADLNESGHQIEDLAAQNRKVVILDTNDEEAAQFK